MSQPTQRFLALWFRHLTTDSLLKRRPELDGKPFVLASPERGRMIVRAASREATRCGIMPNMVVADARAVFPDVEVVEDEPGMAEQLLNALADWCIRYTPIVAVDSPDGLIFDITGCPHLWGGERAYLTEIVLRFRRFGYDVRAAIADTVGTAWAVSRYGRKTPLIQPGCQAEALFPLPPAALRLEPAVVDRLTKLGFYQIRSFMNMPRSVLRRRFGQGLLDRLDQALGVAIELVHPVTPQEPYQERLPCLEPIVTATGIGMALKHLLERLCRRLAGEEKGLRKAILKGYRVDGKVVQMEIGTNGASCNMGHLYRLFELKISTLEPGLGIELFTLEAPVVEDLSAMQEALWNYNNNLEESELIELLDRLTGRTGGVSLQRFVPQEHFWPERAIRPAQDLQEKIPTGWRTDRPRPVHLLSQPEPIIVAAPVPDYPPINFRHRGQLHVVAKSDGPERIEQVWWLESGVHRDYYVVEDREGARFWLFRQGHYDPHVQNWFLHGFFA